MDNTSNEVSKRQILREKLKAGASEISRCISMVEANVEKKSRQLELKEEEMNSLSLDFEKRCKAFEEEKAEAGNLKKLVKECREELWSTKKELESRRESIKLSNSGLELKKKELESLNNRIAVCGEEIDSKSKELGEIQQLIEQQTNEMEERAKEIKAAKTEASDLNLRSERFRQEVEGKEKELNLLKNQIELEEKKLVQLKIEMEEEADRNKKDLQQLISQIKDSAGKQLKAMDEQVESQRRHLEKLSLELVAKEKRHKEILEDISKSYSELESIKTETSELNEKSQSFRRDVEDREKELAQLRNQIKSEDDELTRLKKSIQDCTTELSSRRDQVQAIKKIQREFQLRPTSSVLVRHEQQRTSTCINGNDNSQQIGTETDPDIEDVLMDYEISTILKRNEVSSVLQGSPNPAELVLELVQDKDKEEVGLHDSLVTNCILLFEELAEIQRSEDPQRQLKAKQQAEEPQMQLKAKQVATLWKRKIAIEAPKSSLEVLTFLLFIVAYRLKELINEEETALLASSIARYEQAPGVFVSLSLNPKIREFVKGCIEKSQYIPAVRLICLFKLNTESSPSELLRKEITNLKQKRRTESFQDKDKDAGKLRTILELVAAYKLEIDLPGDLVADLMIKGENSTPHVAQCPVKTLANSPNLAYAQRSGVNLLQFHKNEIKPYLANPSGNGRS